MKALVIMGNPETMEVVPVAFMLHWPQTTVISTTDWQAGIRMAETESPDLVLLDVSVSDGDGLGVLSRIRTICSAPLIAIATHSEESERVTGLELGADDFIVQPFSHMELLARVRAVLRRTSGHELPLPTTVGNGTLFIDFQSQQVTYHGRNIRLTPTQYKLLCQLAASNGRTVPQETLIENVWGEEYLDAPGALLKVHIHRLRQKLGDSPEDSQLIVTVPRRGYRFRLTAS